MRVALPLVACLCLLGKIGRAQEGGPTPGVRKAIEKLKLPGIKINVGERCVDVKSEVCLDEGMLELVACIRDSKEHESIVTVNAKAMHIHTALLLLGVKEGNPAMRKQVGEGEDTRWIDIPPKGGEVNVFLVTENEKGKLIERPISDFIVSTAPAGLGSEKRRFPTHTFIFSGSHVITETKGQSPRTYVADRSGNVISIATFGDELLCLPGIHSHAKGELLWQVDDTHLPKIGTKVTLRLRPKVSKNVQSKND